MRCPYCKTKIERDSRFCEKCGKPIPKKKAKNKIKIICILVVGIVATGGYYFYSQNQKSMESKHELEENMAKTDDARVFLNDYLEKNANVQTQKSEDQPIPTESPDMPSTAATTVPTPTFTPEPIKPTESITPEPTSSPTEEFIYASEATQEEKIQHIREVYYNTQANLDNYSVDNSKTGVTVYYDGDTLKKIVSANGACSNPEYPMPQGYSAEFYYENNAFLFAFVYNGSEEYRFYAAPDDEMKCIRYIGPDGNVQDFDEPVFFTEYFGEMGKFCEAGIAEPYWLGIKVTG